MFYEATLLISPEIQREKVLSVWEDLAKEVEKAGTKVEKDIKPLDRNLAYPITKGGVFRRAYLGVFYLTPKTQASLFLPELTEKLKNHAEVIRFMISKMRAIPTPRPSPSLDTRVKSKTREKETMQKEKPSLEELDKKLEEILEDKISF